ncbi:YrvL family regulatory protein [Vagococcus fluvialis]|uniref:YrvL family regulatory protein n=1 Tax=Vagococcus fluvialis TaxID=2738 RepID=UPI001D0BD648|nr:YrvL family regulatory protein [Vagococcus fluvialis]MDT2781443.1 YrvL family regulatory protein [Vagococcus fluvialis]UDM70199.1 hypothetical protein K5L00_08605 [Vagococcus fluvialis]UDM77618.1 hypothetical protein K5K98_04150 [Vagococcus fluvialis]UDM81888.1 hypothetical protein K5K96_11085 [Vagococcus fluvialis]
MKKQFTAVVFTLIPLGGIILATLGLFKFVGVTYKNNLWLFLFLVLYLIIEFILDNLIEVLATRLNETYWMNFVRVGIALYITDMVMDSVAIGTISLFVLSAVFTVVEYLLDRLDDDNDIYEDDY